MNARGAATLLTVALVSPAGALCHAETAPPQPARPETSWTPGRAIEDLNLVGATAAMPRFADTVLGTESGLRRALLRHGIAIRANALPRFSVNLLDGPVPGGQQVYVGQRPTWITGLNPILTADLRQLGLHDAQLNVGAAWRWTTWDPAGPKTIALSTLYLYKMWRDHLVETKAGYITNDTEFVGLQVGGSLATGALGVYAVLPYQVGLSYFPLTAPSLNVRIAGPKGAYLKTGAQRSLDAAGGAATVARNRTGFRFVPEGDGLLLINEVGYQRSSSPTAHQTWLRAGYLHNRTLYTNKSTGRREAGNYCAYVLFDYQFRRPEPPNLGSGLYVGGTAMLAPSTFNSYDRYYEARLYQKAPFHSRTDDVLSFVAAYRGHSRQATSSLAAQGKTVWQSSPSLTGSYSAHVSRGNYVTVGLSYVRGPAITPRVADTLTFTVSWGLYF